MEKKRVSISAKRQITIPQKFFTKLGFDSEAECVVRGNELVIRPVRTENDGEFAEQILSELISQGYGGEMLLSEFKARRRQVRPAVEQLLAQAEAVASGCAEGETYEDVFGTEGEEK